MDVGNWNLTHCWKCILLVGTFITSLQASKTEQRRIIISSYLLLPFPLCLHLQWIIQVSLCKLPSLHSFQYPSFQLQQALPGDPQATPTREAGSQLSRLANFRFYSSPDLQIQFSSFTSSSLADCLLCPILSHCPQSQGTM